MIIDTHTHIYLNTKQSETDIITNLKNDNISTIISIGVDIKTSQKSIDMAIQNPWIIYATVGIHPCDIDSYKDNIQQTMNTLEKLILDNSQYIKWIWECWFDFHSTDQNKKEEVKQIQEEFFKAQILLALKYNLPIIIHTRDAKEDTLRVLQEMQAKKFILHCFSEDLDFAYKALYYSNECKISFSGIVTYKSATNVQNTAANIPINRILIETDCPFLSPQEVRWTENIPNNTKYNLKKVFELRQINGKKETWEQFEKQIFENSKEIYQI